MTIPSTNFTVHHRQKTNPVFNKILYILLLLALLMLFLFYLGMIQNSSLIEIVEVLLGFLLTLIVQLKIVGFYFQKQMNQYGLDEFGMIKDLIKTKIFGEININYIAKKNKIKYYSHVRQEPHSEDPLFNAESRDVYESLMAKLRANSQLNSPFEKSYSEKIKQIKEKWETLINKINIFEAFLVKFLSSYKIRVKIYKDYKNQVFQKMKADQKWFTEFYVQGIDVETIDQGDLISRRMCKKEQKTKQIFLNALNQVKGFKELKKSLKKQSVSQLQQLDQQYRTTWKKFRETCIKIEDKKKQLNDLNIKIRSSKNKTENVETLFNNEYEHKLICVEIQNLQVKKIYERDMALKKSQKLYQECNQKINSLKTSQDQFEKKNYHYLIQFLDEYRQMNEKLLTSRQKSKNIQKKERELIPENQINDFVNKFKNCVGQLIVLHVQLLSNYKQTSEIIMEYRKSLEAYEEKENDSMLAQTLQTISSKEAAIIQSSLSFMHTQLRICKTNMECSLKHKNILEGLQEHLSVIKKGEEEIYKYTKNKEEYMDANYQNYFQKNDELLEEKETEERINQYNDEIFKIGKHQDTEQEENQQKSLEVVNRLLGVFVQEWSNSELFHELIKEEIQISLNRKRPPFLGHFFVKLLKIQDVNKNAIKNVETIGENDFFCLFQILIDFTGEIAVEIHTHIKGKNIPIKIKILIKHFKCPVRVCFTPFTLGKSYGTLLAIPELQIKLDAIVGDWHLTKIPFITRIIKTFIVIKLRKKMLFPKRFTLSVPMAVKDTMLIAIKQRTTLERQEQNRELKKKKMFG